MFSRQAKSGGERVMVVGRGRERERERERERMSEWEYMRSGLLWGCWKNYNFLALRVSELTKGGAQTGEGWGFREWKKWGRQ